MKKKLALTIGVPALNEEQNIGFLLESILSQKRTNWKLEKLLIVLDGSTDHTYDVAKSFKKRCRQISFIRGKTRIGKALRLNEIFSKSSSELLFLLDADVKLGSIDTINTMVAAFHRNKHLLVAAAAQEPLASDTLIGKINQASFTIWYRLISSYRSGNNIHCLMGCATMLRKTFYNSFSYPRDIVSDQHYLYASVIRHSRGRFSFIQGTRILFRMPSTMRDSRLLGTRAIFDDKEGLKNIFGEEILREYDIPIAQKLRLVVWVLLHMPFWFLASICLGIIVRNFPLRSKRKKSLWIPIVSSKKAIT